MTYTSVLCEKVADVNLGDWNAVCDLVANPFMDVRFLAAVEHALRDESRFWYAILYDADRPVACSLYTLYVVDGALLAPPAAQRMVRSVRRAWKSFFKFKILLCGTPVGTGQGNIAMTADADRQEVATRLDELACRLAKQSRAGFIVFKEFDESQINELGTLKGLGYRVADSVVKYTLKREFGTFDEYYESRSKRTRANMRKYMQKFEEAGLRAETRRGGEGIEQLYTDDVHRLYLSVFQRAELKFELLPAEFFRELARQFPEESQFTLVRRGEKVVAFCCALASPGMHDMLYCGLDYDVNPEGDVYFNLIYRGLEAGIATGAPLINVGQSADEFKRRLGCYSTKLFIFVKAVGAVRSALFNAAFKYVFK